MNNYINKYKFTIITVCMNAAEYIEQTIQSLLCQTYQNYEYIIKDGNSTDDTRAIIDSLVSECENIHIISSKDKGLYDAMNQGVDMAKGEYIYFLNAGDCFADENVLMRISESIEAYEADMVYGNVIQIAGDKRCIRKYGKICKKKFFFLSGDCICHQALFAKRDLFVKKNFDLQYKVCADKDWELFHIFNHATLHNINYQIATILVDGFAKNHVMDFERETHICIKKYYKWTAWIYEMVMIMKKNQIALCCFRWVEKTFFKSKMR